MDVPERRQRTRQIRANYAVSRNRFGNLEEMSDADLVKLEGLLRETIRQFRENLADCVRSERKATTRILGARKSKTAPIELGYAEAKAELNDAISKLAEDKTQVRDARRRPAPDTQVEAHSPAVDPVADDRLIALVDLRTSGVLTADEFAAATARLQ